MGNHEVITQLDITVARDLDRGEQNTEEET